MGVSYSVKDVQDHIERLKERVQKFNGTINSKSYNKLQKEIIQTNTAVLKLKKSQKTKASRECEKMWTDLNECQKILQDRVGKTRLPPDKIKPIEKEPSVPPRRLKRQPVDIINNLEEETKNIETEIEQMIKTNNYKKQALIEGKLKIFFTDLALTKTENGSPLDVRKNKILQRLIGCYKQIDSDFYLEFGSQFGGTNSTRTSMSSNIYEEISYVEVRPKSTQVQTRRQTIIPEVGDFDDLLNIDDCVYEDMTYYGKRTSTLSTKEVKTNLDELLHDDLYGYVEMDGFLKEVLEVANKNEHYKNFEKQSEKINALNDELTNIKDKMEAFCGMYQDEEYLTIENELEKCMEEFNQIDDLGDTVLINGKEEHLAYIETLRGYFEGKAKPYQDDSEESDETNENFIRKKINPPIVKRTSPSESDEDSESEPQKKIYPPIVKPVMVDSSSTEEEERSENEVEPKIVKKINPPILKIVEIDDLTEDSDEENPNRDLLWSNKNGFGDEDQIECDSEQKGENEEPFCDALNIEVLKRLSSIEESPEEQKNVDAHQEQEEVQVEAEKPETEVEEKDVKRINNRRNRGKRNKYALIDYSEKIEEVLEDIEELKTLNETFKQTNNYKLYGEIQEKLMKVIRIMFDMDRSNFDNKSLVLYEIVSQDIQTFVNEL